MDKISLAGDLGSGKSTVSKLVTEALGMEYYSTGTICRAVAARHGWTVVEMNQYMETHPEIDREIDDGLVALSDDPRALLIDSRMAFHFVRDTFRVYLTTEVAVSAARIHAAGRAEEHFATVEETEREIRRRRDSEKKRYMAFYGVNNKDLRHYDLVLDSTYITPEEVADAIVSSFRRWQENGHSLRACYLSPLRLYYREDAPAPEAVAAFTARIEAGERPLVPVVFDGERFLVPGEPALPLSYALSDIPLAPCSLSEETTADDAHYVRMVNAL